MDEKRPSYEELVARLEHAEATLEALRRGEIDSLLGEAGPLLVQDKAVADELARLRAKAEQLAQQWQATFDATSDAVWILDAEQRVVRANKAAEAVLGCPMAEMIGKCCYTIVHGTAAPIHECPFTPMRRSRQRESLETQIGEHWFSITTDPLLDTENNLIGAVQIARDITERKEAEQKIRESEETYRNLFQNAQVGLFRTRIADGKILESNEQLARMFGYDSREEFIAEYVTSQNYVDPGTRERMLRELQEHGEVRNFQARFYRKDHSIFWAEYSAKIYPEKGWIEGVAEDITARKEIEMALQQRYRELTAIYETSQRLQELLPPDLLAQKIIEIVENSLDYTYCDVLLVNKTTGKLEPFALSARGHGPEFVETDKNYIRSQNVHMGEGITGWVALHGTSIRLGDVQQDPRYLAIRENIRSELCVPLRLQEEVIGIVNIESTQDDAYSEDDQRLLENIAAQISVAIQNARLYRHAQQEIEERKRTEAQLRLAQDELHRLLDETERSRIALLSLVEDLQQTQEALSTERTLLRTLIDHLPVSVYVKDINGRKTLANPLDVRNIGVASEADVLGKTDFELFPRELAEAYYADDQQVLLTGQPVINREEPITQPNGQLGWQLTSKVPLRDNAGQIIGLVGIGLDITERKQAEELLRLYAEQLETMVETRTHALQEAQERLLRQERLATLGQIAGGIAHELRTPLGAIKNAAYLINLLLEPQTADAGTDPALREALDILSREVSISDRIITSLLNFARPQQPARHLVEIGEVLQEALAHIEMPPQITVCREITPQLPPVLADAGQLEQIFGNLILNAVQAMPGGGQLTVRAEHCTSLPEIAPPGFTTEPFNGPPTGWIAVTIADTGIGITPENMTRIFEPLFTTKAKGMGLGLALVKLLTQSNGGSLAVSTTPGRGSTFQIFWPIA